MKTAVFLALHSPVAVLASSSSHGSSGNTGHHHHFHHRDQCKHMKEFYQEKTCCGHPDKHTHHQIIPIAKANNVFKEYDNVCAGKKVNFPNIACFNESDIAVLEQAGADVTVNNSGTLNSSVRPTKSAYWQVGMCPVNVHWHIGAEHRSAGQYDESFNDKGPTENATAEQRGFRCGHYNSGEENHTKEYPWKYCSHMKVGETYEVHWPHSALGACGTTNQYQSPFYDGVFCNYNESVHDLTDTALLARTVGVQAQVFTIVNDERYYYPNLIRGMIVEENYGKHITYYTGSTTGSTRNNNDACSQYAPITWQVDRTCHLISASSFDKMCSDMLAQKDDMSGDVHPHGAREVVLSNLSADNHEYNRRLGNDGFRIVAMEYV